MKRRSMIPDRRMDEEETKAIALLVVVTVTLGIALFIANMIYGRPAPVRPPRPAPAQPAETIDAMLRQEQPCSVSPCGDVPGVRFRR